MSEDLEYQSLENLLEKLLPIEQEKPYTFFKRYIRHDENKNTQKVVFKSSIPWNAKIPWEYASFPGLTETYSRTRASLYHRYYYRNFSFKSVLDYSFSRLIFRSKAAFWKDGFEVGIAQGSTLEKVPEYLDLSCSYSRRSGNYRTNLLYLPELSTFVVTSSLLRTRYVSNPENEKAGKVYKQMLGAEMSLEPLPLRPLRMILFHQRHYDNGKITLAYIHKSTGDESYLNKFLVAYTQNLLEKKKLLSCLAFDIKHGRLVFHAVYTRPHEVYPDSKVRYRISSEGRIGSDIIVRKKNSLITGNFELNFLPLAQKESYGLIKFGFRYESVYEKLFSELP